MNIAKIISAGALVVSALLSVNSAVAATPAAPATEAAPFVYAKAAPTPESIEFFRQIWDNAILFAYRGYAQFAQSTCDIYRSQVWPDPGANEVATFLNIQCRRSVVNIVIHHTPPFPFPL